MTFGDLLAFQVAVPDWEVALYAAYEDARAYLPRPPGEEYRPLSACGVPGLRR